MAYVSLYRKYRPQTFADIVGQTHVVSSLQNAIREDAVGHAYLFAGPRGTGKTTIARILAMAINAEGGPTPDPDPEAPVSVSIREGRSMDVIELDMASHGGVDDARELRDRAVFAPVELRKKVYILDEVHMASTAAFNALLKLIEEPPPHVMFAMATTDPQKVLPTILSRVQRLDLRRIGAADLGAHVRRIAELEGFAIDDAALAQVLRAGEGSARDTLSILEQVAAFAGAGANGAVGIEITEGDAAKVLGRSPLERTLEVVDHLVAGNVAGTFSLVQGLLDDGHDLRRFTLDLVQHLRDLLVVQAAPDRPDLIDASEQHRAALADQATRLPRERLVFAVTVLGDILVEQRTGPPRLPLELALARLAVPEASGDMAALASRVAALEQGVPRTAPVAAPAAPPVAPVAPAPLDAPGPAAAAAPTAPASEPVAEAPEVTPAPAPTRPVAVDPEPAPEPVLPPAAAEPAAASPAPVPIDSGDLTIEVVAQRWEAIMDVVLASSKKAYAMYMHARPARLHNNVLTLTYPRDKSFHREQSLGGELVGILRTAVQETCGVVVTVDAVEEGTVERRPSPEAVTPRDARVAVDPFTGGDPNEARPRSEDPGDRPGSDEADEGPPDEAGEANPFDAAPGEGEPAARASVADEPVDEQALVREAEFGDRSGPDFAQARASVLAVLEATEVDESEIA